MEEISLSKKQLSFNKRRALISFVCIFAVVLVFVVGGVFIGRWWVKNDPMNPWKVESYQSDMEEGNLEHLLLPMNETMTIDVENYAKKWGVENKAWKLSVADGCVRVDEDTLTPVDRGWTVLTLQITDGSTVYSSDIACIVVISSDPFKSVSTAEELSAIRDDLDGNYILTADIDLSGMEWTPIGKDANFTGAFINPESYKIKNLTMKNNVLDGTVNSYTAGLFSRSVQAYFSGIILQDVLLDLPTEKELCVNSSVGGLIGSAFLTNIIDCSVNGDITGQGTVGGLVGYMDGGYCLGCTFNGNVTALSCENISSPSIAGGLFGKMDGRFETSYGKTYSVTCVIDCSVNADITGEHIAGSIIGMECGYKIKIEGCYFNGSLHSENIGKIYGQTHNEKGQYKKQVNS